jgi:hypothetical protein
VAAQSALHQQQAHHSSLQSNTIALVLYLRMKLQQNWVTIGV